MDACHAFPVSGGFSEWQDRYRRLADISCAKRCHPVSTAFLQASLSAALMLSSLAAGKEAGSQGLSPFSLFGPNLTKAKWLSQRMRAMEDREPERALRGIQFGSVSHPFSL